MPFVKHGVARIDGNLSDLTVFIAYKTEQWAFASWLASQLRIVGFQVQVIPPATASERLQPRHVIETRLRRVARDADCFCLVASPQSLDSEWVQFEYKEAVENIGRLTFVCEGELFPAGEKMIVKNPGFLSNRFYIKSDTVVIPKEEDKAFKNSAYLQFYRDNAYFGGERPSDIELGTPSSMVLHRTEDLPVNGSIIALAHELVSDPEEGFAGPPISKSSFLPYTPGILQKVASIWQRRLQKWKASTTAFYRVSDLKMKSLMEKHARSHVLADPRFSDKFIYDVLPFIPHKVSAFRHYSRRALRWILDRLTGKPKNQRLDFDLEEFFDTFGFYKVRERLVEGVVEPLRVSYPVLGDHQLKRYGLDRVEAFIFLARPGWKELLATKERVYRRKHQDELDAIGETIRRIEKERELLDGESSPAEVPNTEGTARADHSLFQSLFWVLCLFLTHSVISAVAIGKNLLLYTLFQLFVLLGIGIFLKRHQQSFGLNVGNIGNVVITGLVAGLLTFGVAYGLRQFQNLFLPANVAVAGYPAVGFERIGLYTAAFVISPMLEELLFRGLIFRILFQSGHRKAAFWASSLLYAACIGRLEMMLPMAFMSFVCAFLFLKTGNLWTAIVGHSIFNVASAFEAGF